MKTKIEEKIKAMGSIVALCQNENQDGSRTFTEWVRFVKDVGIEDDPGSISPTCTHLSSVAGEVGILSWDNVVRMLDQDAEFEFGHCGENVCVTSGKLSNLQSGDLLQMGRALLEVTQVGKECDRPCSLSATGMEPCPLAKTWIFARVVKGGQVCVDDTFVATCHL